MTQRTLPKIGDVLKVLEEVVLEPDFITGTNMVYQHRFYFLMIRTIFSSWSLLMLIR